MVYWVRLWQVGVATAGTLGWGTAEPKQGGAGFGSGLGVSVAGDKRG